MTENLRVPSNMTGYEPDGMDERDDRMTPVFGGMWEAQDDGTRLFWSLPEEDLQPVQIQLTSGEEQPQN